jgi:hypothetical protein
MAIRSQPLLALRLSLAATRPVPGFEPSLQYSVLWVVNRRGIEPTAADALPNRITP